MDIITTLSFVKKSHEVGDIYTFYFTLEGTLNHKAGQHGIFILPGLHRPHPFTLSSAPEEEFITFTTHTDTGSPFKRKLMSMQAGTKIYMFGPVLDFTFASNEPNHVFLAQGIGITPFRSMLVHAHNAHLPINTTLIHVDSKEHAFKDLTQQYATNAFYPERSEEFRNEIKRQDTKQIFYLSGSPRFVSSTKKLLHGLGVARKKIKTDSFLGY